MEIILAVQESFLSNTLVISSVLKTHQYLDF